MKRHLLLRQFVLFAVLTVLVACTKVPITGRRQFNMLPESEMISMSLTNYSDFLKKNPPVTTSKDADMVKRVGKKISDAVTRFLVEKGQSKRIEGYAWEYNLVNSPEVNAWCMPGGKVVVYTGLLPITKDETGLAIVMGHEIAHAVARHGNERMSQQMAVQLGGVALDVATQQKSAMTRDIFLQSYGAGSTLGILAYSRKHESEADKLGLVFAAMAGYDPQQAVPFWQRMASGSAGQKPPELLSTHPSDQTRIDDLKAFMPTAMKYYKPGS